MNKTSVGAQDFALSRFAGVSRTIQDETKRPLVGQGSGCVFSSNGGGGHGGSHSVHMRPRFQRRLYLCYLSLGVLATKERRVSWSRICGM